MKYLKNENKLKSAGMSTGDTKWNDKSIRGDLHLWIHDTKKYENECPHMVKLLNKINSLKEELNENCKFNSNKVQMQVTCYPGNNTRYVKHLDSKKEGPDRRITCLFYCNPNWIKEDGGELRVYKDDSQNLKDFVDISPLCDRLLIFQSRRLIHEVLETKKDRFAITSWFY
jgi:Rps23 Pro-64 3,4-dihydroxylase Tpa1-like proline 4-hydroxylase